MPPTLDKATKDKPFFYALGLRDGSVIEFEGAEYLGDLGWVRLEGAKPIAGPLSQHKYTLDRGIEVAIEEIVWAADAPRGS